jgi:hypothetical protein
VKVVLDQDLHHLDSPVTVQVTSLFNLILGRLSHGAVINEDELSCDDTQRILVIDARPEGALLPAHEDAIANGHHELPRREARLARQHLVIGVRADYGDTLSQRCAVNDGAGKGLDLCPESSLVDQGDENPCRWSLRKKKLTSRKSLAAEPKGS